MHLPHKPHTLQHLTHNHHKAATFPTYLQAKYLPRIFFFYIFNFQLYAAFVCRASEHQMRKSYLQWYVSH